MSRIAASRRFDLILFDLDGTLVDSAPEMTDAVNDTLAGLGLPQVSLEQVCRWVGKGTRELVVQALASAARLPVDEVRSGPQLAVAMEYFEQHYLRRCGTRSHLFPHVREVLQALRQRGVHLAMVTNKDSRFTRVLLDAHSLTPLFEIIVSGDSLAAKKPDPGGVRACLEVFRVEASRTLFVGDSSIDVATARAAGVTVWALTYGYNMGKPIQESAPDRVIQDCSALLAVLSEADDLQTV